MEDEHHDRHEKNTRAQSKALMPLQTNMQNCEFFGNWLFFCPGEPNESGRGKIVQESTE